MSNLYNGSLYTNNSNAVEDGAYLIVNFKINYRLHLNNYLFAPFMGINNILDTEYNDNIRINGFGSRFYEPAPLRNIYVGLKIRFSKNSNPQ